MHFIRNGLHGGPVPWGRPGGGRSTGRTAVRCFRTCRARRCARCDFHRTGKLVSLPARARDDAPARFRPLGPPAWRRDPATGCWWTRALFIAGRRKALRRGRGSPRTPAPGLAALRGIVDYQWSPDSRLLLVPLAGRSLHLRAHREGRRREAVRRLTRTEAFETDREILAAGALRELHPRAGPVSQSKSLQGAGAAPHDGRRRPRGAMASPNSSPRKR